MCGITGYWSLNLLDEGVADRMARAISTRGPDDAGIWTEESSGIVLAHRRLSILDLSAAGHQPMVSPCESLVLSYNGEIYNHLELREELQANGGAFDWRGHSDTETLLAVLRHWGVQGGLERLNGMFAFALWDRREKRLFLARDRMGEKPLYYGKSGGNFLFGSELKALRAHPAWEGEINRNALTLFLRHNYIPAPWSIYRGIQKLPPAHFVVIGGEGKEVAEPVCYWDLGKIAEEGSDGFAGDPQEMIEELNVLLRDAVSRRMMADVPLGAFLSGGFDSSLVTALMQAQSSRPVQTFSIGFKESAYNEAHHAKAVAEHLGTDHTELYVTPDDARAVIPRLPEIYDEPFSDSSQIPTFLVSQLARQQVTVSLSGDGGDELFYGYRRYLTGENIWRKCGWIPSFIRKSASCALRNTPRKLFSKGMRISPGRLVLNHVTDRLFRIGEVLGHGTRQSFYRHLVSHNKVPDRVVLGGTEPQTILSDESVLPELPGLREEMMYLDQMSYLPGDILTKVDRASMAVSLEARVPLLDHRVIEFAWKVPTALKYREGQTKWLLRQVLEQYVPRKLTERPKMGFGIPIGHWLRGSLRDWGESLLDENRLRQEGFFDPRPVRRMWEEHQGFKKNWHYYLWDILMFQIWFEKN